MASTGAELVREAAREERESAIDEAWSVGWRGRRYALPQAGPGARLAHRALRLLPQDLAWKWLADDALQLSFALPPGAYATTVLAEVGDFPAID